MIGFLNLFPKKKKKKKKRKNITQPTLLSYYLDTDKETGEDLNHYLWEVRIIRIIKKNDG